MKIICWGSRGSIPVSGKEYLKYGGDTTCIEIRTKDNEVIIIDAGSGIRKLGKKLREEGCKQINMIFTHAHWDHLIGFPFFKPIYFKDTRVELFGCPFAQESISQIISKSMDPPYFPINFDYLSAEIISHGTCSTSFSIGSVRIHPILLSHPNQGIGYRFEEDGKVFVFLTDNELTYKHPGGLEFKDYCKFSMDADLLIHDAEFTYDEYNHTKTWGHSVYNDALDLAIQARVKQFGLFHHNQDRQDFEIDKMVEDCDRIIIERKAETECFAVSKGFEIEL